MPRCRIIKPELLVDERLARLSPEARLFIIGASTLADSNGVLENRPLRIKLASMPHDSTNADAVIASLLMERILSKNEDGKFLRIEAFKQWFRSFPNEEKLLQDDEYICGTNVEHGQASTMLVTCLVQATDKDKDKDKFKDKRKEKNDPLFPITASKDTELQDWYLEAVECYPKKDSGHNSRSGQVETRRITRDCPQAQKNFHSLVASGCVSARELYVCAWIAARDWAKKRDEYLFIPNLSSFFSSGEKNPWAAWIESAREAIELMDREVDNE